MDGYLINITMNKEYFFLRLDKINWEQHSICTFEKESPTWYCSEPLGMGLNNIDQISGMIVFCSSKVIFKGLKLLVCQSHNEIQLMMEVGF